MPFFRRRVPFLRPPFLRRVAFLLAAFFRAAITSHPQFAFWFTVLESLRDVASRIAELLSHAPSRTSVAFRIGLEVFNLTQ